MNELVIAFQNLLRGHITLVDDADIFFGSRYSPIDRTPCITLGLASESFVRRMNIEKENVEYLKKIYESEVWINVWCNTEEQRKSIVEEVHQRIIDAETNNFTTCNFFEENKCKHTDETCLVLTSTRNRARKNQCPDPELYKSFFKTNNIMKKTFSVGSILNLDDTSTTETTLRTIFRIRMQHSTYHQIGGTTFKNIYFDGELL